MKIFYFALLFSFPCAKIANAQSTSTLMGARAAGMGYTSATLTDEWVLFNNVGGIGKIKQANAAFAYEIRPALTGANRMAAEVTCPTKIGALALGLFRFGDDVYSEQLASFGFGNHLGNTSLGTKINYVQYRAEGFGINNGITFDFGGITTITPQILVGAYITNLTQSKLNNTDQLLPTKLTLGVGFKPIDNIFLSTEIEKYLDYQTTWRGGLEYAIYKKMFLRTGFNLNPNAGYVGFGGQKNKLKVDYAFRYNQLLGSSHHASAIYLLVKPRDKK